MEVHGEGNVGSDRVWKDWPKLVDRQPPCVDMTTWIIPVSDIVIDVGVDPARQAVKLTASQA